MIKIVSIQKLTNWNPVQWEAKTIEGHIIYIRERHGYFTVDAIFKDDLEWDFPLLLLQADVIPYTHMTFEEMSVLTASILDFSEVL